MTIDVGTGDGRAVLAAAAADPAGLALGLDSSAASMAESSRRAARPPGKGGLPNARFVLGSAELPPTALNAIARLVTVRFPWGSLLRGCLGRDDRVAAGVASLIAADGALELTLAPAPRDRLDERLPTEPDAIIGAAGAAFEPHGLILVEARPASNAEVEASTWGRRLMRGAGGAVDSNGRRPMTVRFRSIRA